jgi:Skp family chaperone for outer membrane proteins
MKYKVLFLLTIIGLMSFSTNAQRGVRIGYIDTEYILQNVPEYQEASTLLDKKVLQWKTEIEKRLSSIEQKKKELDNESVLLTKELYNERYEDISFEEAEILDYQQKRFGPSGDLMVQKRQLIEPIQDQIFAAVQEIATTKKYDFVFDKSADVVMLYSAERYDISEQVLRTITRTSKRSQVKSKKERQELEDEAVVPEVSEAKDERQQALEDKKITREAEFAARRAAREKVTEDARAKRLELREAKKLEANERRQKVIDARTPPPETEEEAKTIAKDTLNKSSVALKVNVTKDQDAVKKDSTSTKKPLTEAEIKAKDREIRRKELEARKQKIIDQRKKAREERLKQVKRNDSIAKAKQQEENN